MENKKYSVMDWNGNLIGSFDTLFEAEKFKNNETSFYDGVYISNEQGIIDWQDITLKQLCLARDLLDDMKEALDGNNSLTETVLEMSVADFNKNFRGLYDYLIPECN